MSRLQTRIWKNIACSTEPFTYQAFRAKLFTFVSRGQTQASSQSNITAVPTKFYYLFCRELRSPKNVGIKTDMFWRWFCLLHCLNDSRGTVCSIGFEHFWRCFDISWFTKKQQFIKNNRLFNYSVNTQLLIFFYYFSKPLAIQCFVTSFLPHM